jgi:hypothetical protein
MKRRKPAVRENMNVVDKHDVSPVSSGRTADSMNEVLMPGEVRRAVRSDGTRRRTGAESGQGDNWKGRTGEKEDTHRLTSGANLPPRLLISWILLLEVTIEIEVE